MAEEKVVYGLDVDTIWQELEADLNKEDEVLEYHAILQQDNRRVLFDIDIDLGGGFESGMSVTTFNSYLYNRDSFRFAIHKQGFVDEIGKFFGMQDVVLGYKEFDDHFIVKTNDEARAALIFADEETRATLTALPDLSFGIVHYLLEAGNGKAPFLELRIEDSITDPSLLKRIYTVFFNVLVQVD